ncbi:hypothetical protein ACF1BU_17050 [Streptomyces sp. NPDC014724]|uniref:hypothetical protein n=1 Tax=unclassified Streptomyces TaxID=2593676 RepID=UPI0036FF3B63
MDDTGQAVRRECVLAVPQGGVEHLVLADALHDVEAAVGQHGGKAVRREEVCRGSPCSAAKGATVSTYCWAAAEFCKCSGDCDVISMRVAIVDSPA